MEIFRVRFRSIFEHRERRRKFFASLNRRCQRTFFFHPRLFPSCRRSWVLPRRVANEDDFWRLSENVEREKLSGANNIKTFVKRWRWLFHLRHLLMPHATWNTAQPTLISCQCRRLHRERSALHRDPNHDQVMNHYMNLIANSLRRYQSLFNLNKPNDCPLERTNSRPFIISWWKIDSQCVTAESPAGRSFWQFRQKINQLANGKLIQLPLAACRSSLFAFFLIDNWNLNLTTKSENKLLIRVEHFPKY